MSFIRVLKGGLSQQEKDQLGALDNNAVGNYNIYQDGWGEIFLTNHKFNDGFALMDTTDTFEQAMSIIENDWVEHATYILYDKELEKEYTNYYGITIDLDAGIPEDSEIDVDSMSDDELEKLALEHYDLYDLSEYYAN